jgi:hypothetical protein
VAVSAGTTNLASAFRQPEAKEISAVGGEPWALFAPPND